MVECVHDQILPYATLMKQNDNLLFFPYFYSNSKYEMRNTSYMKNKVVKNVRVPLGEIFRVSIKEKKKSELKMARHSSMLVRTK